ncbi:MAG TPA: sulfite exporter TauE/SafE family protein [Bryobacteraceae bacterium]|nr:sulfite exporter TauE/SafE family protein [Bryobacteraceae bacterium]
MHFPISGIECPFWLPPLVAFLIALATTPAGVSGAFLLLPFQMSVLGFVSPAVTPTNLVYNIISTPGGVFRYIREHHMNWALAWAIAAGSAPGVFLGAVIRVRYLPDPRYCKLFVAVVLVYLAMKLVADTLRARGVAKASLTANPWMLTLLALPVGVIGGIYGVGGGAIIAPFAVTSMRVPAKVIAGPAMLGTFITSLAGVASFEFLQRAHAGGAVAAGPDWMLGLFFGAGGFLGSYCGARLQKHLPERWIRLSLAILVLAIASSYAAQFFLVKRT